MNFSGCIRFVLVSFLVEILLPGGLALITDYQKQVFRAREAEANRNRVKYMSIIDDESMFTGFVLNKDLNEFVLPTLSNNNNLEQTFTFNDKKFELVCRDKYPPDFVETQQRSALHVLKRGILYFYSSEYSFNGVIPFKFVPAPLTKKEEKIIVDEDKSYAMCEKKPMPGLKLVKDKSNYVKKRFNKNLKYTYGEKQKTCYYFELGIETLRLVYKNLQKSRVQTRNFWAPLFHVCHDPTNSVTVFMKHTIKWDHLKHRKLNPNISVTPHEEEIFVDQDYSQYYDLKNQKKSFKARGCEKEREEFDKESNYLVRAHLVPDHDMLYESFQYITSNYINYVPQWRSVNMGQWLKVEQDIRSVALKVQKDLTVYTGVYYGNRSKKLIIPVKVEEEEEEDENISTSSKTTVESKSIPIPSAFYKYVHTDKAGIVIITANGVSGLINDIRCRNVCKLYGWVYQDDDKRHRNSVSSGQTKCCIPAEFLILKEIRNSLPSLPAGIDISTKILTFDGHEVDFEYIIV